ncbi:polysaccharide biosynthesis/export family protein [Mesorhizobium sp. SP-1A]|uniref:polysaccharide biosynthesis/export family protein n=1 Tax=Mesorhizobium sp. SP-1A TaxID=3077840 RepID=UPI0028F6D582|nr:polysaccharide biosynthesis/export family protein [Mesorhizobium sp. SP-1A]
MDPRRKFFLAWLGGVAAVMMQLAPVAPAQANEATLQPQTKIKLTVVQWMPTKGEYQDWQALGGEFVVSRSGTVQLPVIGSLSVTNLDSAGLATEIATRLKAKMGLVDKPDTTVDIVEYPPLYIVGDVTKPGEYRFRDGITALQALALSGGPLRSMGGRAAEIQLVAGMKATAEQILRGKVKIARLEAEMAGAAEPDFRAVQADGADPKTFAQIAAQERLIFTTRAKEIERQTKTLNDLRDLLNAEINVLQEKIKAADVGIENTKQELTGVTMLVQKGIAVVSRKSDLERLLASLQADRLDQVTAIMRARQNIAQATRDLEGIQDRHQTEVATELQQEQARQGELGIKQAASQKLLLDQLSSGGAGAEDDNGMHLSVLRSDNGKETEIAATELTVLVPGDVLRVRLDRPVSNPAAPDATPAPAQAEAGTGQEASQ